MSARAKPDPSAYRVHPPEEGIKIPTFVGARLGQAGTQFRLDWRYHLVTRQQSDSRSRDQIRADALREDDERETHREGPSRRALDESEAQDRYDAHDQGGHRWDDHD